MNASVAPVPGRPGSLPPHEAYAGLHPSTSDELSRASGAIASDPKHIAVCICTYKRPLFLQRLLDELGVQETGGGFTYSIVVADNDHQRSAEAVVLTFASASQIPIKYCVEPRQGIPLVRNKAIENAEGDFVALIDDDEFPTRTWLQTLFTACTKYGVDGVLGPVKRHFDEEPPKWVVKGNFYQRETYRTGLVIDWTKGRTNNTLLRKQIFEGSAHAFDPEIRTGEDMDFFRRMIEKGHAFIWCNEAVVYEVVPPVRWKRTFMVRRALLQGRFVPVVDPAFGARAFAKSLIAVFVYTAALPVALILGHHRFMALVVKLFYHLGSLLALLGINPIKVPYVTE